MVGCSVASLRHLSRVEIRLVDDHFSEGPALKLKGHLLVSKLDRSGDHRVLASDEADIAVSNRRKSSRQQMGQDLSKRLRESLVFDNWRGDVKVPIPFVGR